MLASLLQKRKQVAQPCLRCTHPEAKGCCFAAALLPAPASLPLTCSPFVVPSMSPGGNPCMSLLHY
jgi:hypothetical protein